MAWDLWGSSYDQDTVEGSDDDMQSEWQCDFYFGYGHDVIEENALNEKYCIQVLRIQITKADVEIDELERNLVSLQAEVLFVEDEEWREAFSKALSDKIDDLNISVRGLRNKSQTVTELQLSIHREPAEKLEDILKAIMKKHFQEIEKQKPPLLINLESKSDASANSTKLSKSIERSQLVSDISVKEESGETNALEEKHASKISSSNLQEKKTDCSEEIKVLNEQPSHINTLEPSPDCLRLAAVSSDEENKLAMVESGGITKQLEAIEKDPNSKDEKMVENESLRHEKKRGVDAAQTADAIIKPSSSDYIMFSNECFSVVKSLSESDTERNMEVSMGLRKEHSITTNGVHCEKDRAHDVAPNAIVEYISLERFIESAAVNARNASSEFNLSTSIPEKCGDNDVDVKLVEFVRQVTGKEGIRGSKTGKVAFKADQVGEPEVESQKAVIAFQKSHSNFVQTQQSNVTKRTLESDSQGNITAELVVGKPGVEISKKPFVAFDKSHLNASLRPQSQRTKRKSQPDSQSFGGQSISSTKKKYNTSSLTTYKRRKDDADDIDSSLKELLLGKHSKKSTLLEPSAKELGPLPIAIQHALPQPPLIAHNEELTIDLKFPDPRTNASDGDSLGNNSNSWALVPTHAPTVKLKDLRVPDLKALAKRHNLNSYSKLKKDELIKFLAERLGSAI